MEYVETQDQIHRVCTLGLSLLQTNVIEREKSGIRHEIGMGWANYINPGSQIPQVTGEALTTVTAVTVPELRR